MKLHRFFVEPSAISGKAIILTDKNVIGQIKKVLRLRVGDKVIFLNGRGEEFVSVIEEVTNSEIKAYIEESEVNKNEPNLKITLCQALCKKDKFEWVLQKGTEVGVSEFVPVLADRSEKTGLNLERAEKILREAAEQSERGIIPKLYDMRSFSEALRQAQGEKIILDKSGEPIKKITNKLTDQLTIFVGPEGGWTETEIDLAKSAGAKIVSTGSTVLRTETAGMVAAAILLNR